MIHIIPAIDIIDGKCVRLTQGDYSQKKIYNQSPLEVAKEFENAGIKRLHLVDLDGAKQKRIINHRVLEKIAAQTNLNIDFGGGLQSDEDLKIAFESGAKQITGGSIAIKSPETFLNWLEAYGQEKIILGADVKEEKVAVSGWTETSEMDVYQLLEKYIQKGVKYTISTDVSKDGMLRGPSIELYKNIQKRFPGLNLIASGGIGKWEDILELSEMDVFGVIVGKAIYEGKISLKEIEKYHAH